MLEQKRELEPEQSLINVHMMLAAFAIENLCKGYLAGRLSREERERVKAGILPESLKTHDVLDLVGRTPMTLSDTEKFLVRRISEAVWRGRYPSATSHKKVGPFAQIGSDVRPPMRFSAKAAQHVGAKDSYCIPPTAGRGLHADQTSL